MTRTRFITKSDSTFEFVDETVGVLPAPPVNVQSSTMMMARLVPETDRAVADPAATSTPTHVQTWVAAAVKLRDPARVVEKLRPFTAAWT